MEIKKFEAFNDKTIVRKKAPEKRPPKEKPKDEFFETIKKEVKEALSNLIEVYDDFTNDVSPLHWRTTGSHMTDLRKMASEIDNMTPITNEERDRAREYRNQR